MSAADGSLTENPVERYLLTQARRHGFLCMKFVSPGRGGVPDRILVAPAATVFVELKRPGQKPDARQRATHTKLRRHGAEVHVVDDRSGIDALLAELDRRDPRRTTRSTS